MKINLILAINNISGGAITALKYLDFFRKKGDDVVCYIPKTGFHHGWKKIAMIKSLFLWNHDDKWREGLKQFNVSYSFPLTINNKSIRDADVTIATSWITSYWVENLSPSKGKKVYFIQGYETWGNNKENRLVENSYSLPFDLRITVSTDLHDRILRNAGTESNIICNGIEEDFIQNNHNKELRKTILTIGFPYREDSKRNVVKNCELGIRVLKNILQNNSLVNVKTFGFKQPENWDNNIPFLENPTREELKEFYDNVDIFYVPSLYEGWGLPAMEAMARGDAVVAHDSGFIHEYGKNGYNCILLRNPSGYHETVEDIEVLIKDRQLLALIQKNGFGLVKNLTFEKSAEQFYSELHRLA